MQRISNVNVNINMRIICNYTFKNQDKPEIFIRLWFSTITEEFKQGYSKELTIGIETWYACVNAVYALPKFKYGITTSTSVNPSRIC